MFSARKRLVKYIPAPGRDTQTGPGHTARRKTLSRRHARARLARCWWHYLSRAARKLKNSHLVSQALAPLLCLYLRECLAYEVDDGLEEEERQGKNERRT